MKDHIEKYKSHLEKTIGEYMERPVSERSAEAVSGMLDCWAALDKAEKKMHVGKEMTFTHEDAKMWAEKLINDDGTTGPHWDIVSTNSVAASIGLKFEHISDWCWWIAINAMYSDYCAVAMKYGVDTAEFYADMAKAFLFDKDAPSPMEKLAKYYHCIVCSKEMY